ncbi:BTAD domain-containing putative transcriptional regulator [Kutzneria buriramensis]|nr:BTAD domain-containing putative transcriptional regulator [Kutzneria buriramensis]
MEVRLRGRPLALGPRQRRLVLALLACEVNRVVAVGRLVELVWPSSPPQSAVHAIQVNVSGLRSVLADTGGQMTLETHGAGYLLRADPLSIDLHRFTALLTQARQTNDDLGRVALIDEALALWRGPMLVDTASEFTQHRLGAGLFEARLVAIEDRLDALLRVGRHGEVVDELIGLVDAHPTRERLIGQLMLALYRGGQPGQALEVFRRARKHLADELGIDAGVELRQLEMAILNADAALARPSRAASARSSPRLGSGSMFVGRRRELAQLAEWRAKAMSRQTTVVLLEGPAGIGKSTLLDSFSKAGKVLRGNGVGDEGAPAYWPWRQVFRQWLAGVEPTVAADTLGDAADKIARIVPELHRFAGRATELRPATAEERFALFDQVTEFVTRMAADGLVIVIDDLHWADPASLLLFGHLARSVHARLLLVGAFRPYELRQIPRGVAVLAEVTRLPGARRLELTGLSTAEVAEQLTAELGRPCEPDEAATVARRTGGNPLFVREIGRLRRTDPNAVPTGARDAIHQYLSVLSPSCRGLLTTASVLSTDIDPVALAAVSDATIEEALNALDEAVAASVVDPGYRFAHDLVRDCLALDLAAADRARIHLRAAEDLEARNGHPAQIAHHRLAALPLGDAAAATAAAVRAAEQAVSQLAYEDAVRLYDEAIRANGGPDVNLLIGKATVHYQYYDDESARQARAQAAELARATGDATGLARAALGRLERADPTWQMDPAWLDTVMPWCEQAQAELPEGDSVLRARLLTLWATITFSAGDENAAVCAVDAALAMAERLGSPEALAATLWARQHVNSGPDGNHERLALGTRMIGLAGRIGSWTAVWGHLWRFDALMQLGRVPEADLELDLLEPVVARLNRPVDRLHLHRSRAGVLQGRGRFTEAERHLAEAARLAERGRNPYGIAVIAMGRAFIGISTDIAPGAVPEDVLDRGFGWRIMARIALAAVSVEVGDLDRAREIYRGLPPLAEVPKPAWFTVLVLAQYGGVAAALGDVMTADAVYRELLPHADLHITAGAGVMLTSGSARHILGLTAAVCGRIDDAIDHMSTAVAVNTEAGLDACAADSRCQLARLLRQRGDHAEAQRHAREAHAAAVRLGMPRLVARATALM